MTLRQLEIFLAVTRAKNFTRAAETLHVSQSTISQHVLELERELGVRLFPRLGRAVTLTEAGRLFEEHASRIRVTVASALPYEGGLVVSEAHTGPTSERAPQRSW